MNFATRATNSDARNSMGMLTRGAIWLKTTITLQVEYGHPLRPQWFGGRYEIHR